MSTSPYNPNDAFQLLYDENEYSLERTDKSNTLTPSGITHTILEGETLQNIAFKYYKDSGRWGDIATFNALIDPLDIEKGMVIQIPQ